MVAVLADIPKTGAVPPSLRLVDDLGGLALVPRRHHAAVYWRRRAAALGLLLVVAVLSVVAVQSALVRIGGGPLTTTDATGGATLASTTVWVVRPGDTLWGIARAIDPRGDVRPIVDRLAAQVGSAPLYPGERIALPPRG